MSLGGKVEPALNLKRSTDAFDGVTFATGFRGESV